jgi:hypothetical protein
VGLQTQITGKAGLEQISNPNLLDNPWFTINQRGLTTSLGGYIVDRWNAQSTSKLDVISNGIKFTNIQDTDVPTWIRQNIELSAAELLVGKNLTISVMSVNGNIFSIPFVLKSTNTDIGTDFSFEGITCRLRYEWQTGFLSFLFYVVHKDDEISLRAFKLELGSISTLAMDTAPNYAEELLKCQRYFERSHWYSWGCIQCITAGLVNRGMTYPFSVIKRVTPTFRFNVSGNTGIGNGFVHDLTDGTTIPNSEVVLVQPFAYNTGIIQIQLQHSSFVAGHQYAIAVGDNCVDISADL